MTDDQDYSKELSQIAKAIEQVPQGPRRGEQMTAVALVKCLELRLPWHYAGLALKQTIEAATGYRGEEWRALP